MLVWCIRGLVLCLCRSEKDKEELLLSPSPLITLSLSELVHTISNIYTHQFNFLLHASVRVSIWPQVFYDLTLQIFYILPASFPPEARHHEGQTSLIPWFKVDEITSDQENTDPQSYLLIPLCVTDLQHIWTQAPPLTPLCRVSLDVCVLNLTVVWESRALDSSKYPNHYVWVTYTLFYEEISSLWRRDS